MGMFDTLKSSYNIGSKFRNKLLQTKDLQCVMCCYWISPAGQLFLIDYSGTNDFLFDDNAKEICDKFQTVPNGNHGKVTPVYVNKTIEVYTANDELLICYLHFVEGKIEKVIRS